MPLILPKKWNLKFLIFAHFLEELKTPKCLFKISHPLQETCKLYLAPAGLYKMSQIIMTVVHG